MSIVLKKLISRLGSVFIATVICLSVSGNAFASVNNPSPVARVSFSFDDGFQSTYTKAAPTLAKYGFSGTSYVPTACIGMTTVPNTCQADQDKKYMTWDQVSALKNTYNWEIGSHTNTHPLLASSDPDVGQPNVLTPQQVIDELAISKNTLASHGITDTTIATPYGDYNPSVLSQIAKYYPGHRGFADTGYNTWPYSDYLIRTQQVQVGVSVAKVKKYIDTAIANKQWLVLTFHDIKGSPVDYDYTNANLDKIAAYVKSKNVQVTTVRQALVEGDNNLLPNGSFNQGISAGWTTDNPPAFTSDNSGNGSYPDSLNSIRMNATTTNSHLFSPLLDVNGASSYVLKSFSNTISKGTGNLGFYIDEYDADGNWISGQYKASQPQAFVDSINFSYKPTNNNVFRARLQIILPANSAINGYLDNIEWFVSEAGVVVPPVQPVNLMTNGTFDNGISVGWSTDGSSVFIADGLNNGSPSNPINSVKFVGAGVNKHLFSPKISVLSPQTYSISCYLNIIGNNSGAVGFYIDEYDADGNWISGQYKATVVQIGAGRVAINYTPSSSLVAKSSLQIIVSGDSSMSGYFDDVIWQ